MLAHFKRWQAKPFCNLLGLGNEPLYPVGSKAYEQTYDAVKDIEQNGAFFRITMKRQMRKLIFYASKGKLDDLQDGFAVQKVKTDKSVGARVRAVTIPATKRQNVHGKAPFGLNREEEDDQTINLSDHDHSPQVCSAPENIEIVEVD
jgi:hypothetical protein